VLYDAFENIGLQNKHWTDIGVATKPMMAMKLTVKYTN